MKKKGFSSITLNNDVIHTNYRKNLISDFPFICTEQESVNKPFKN